MTRETQQLHNVTSRCKILVWHYNEIVVTDDNEDIEDYSSTLYKYENTEGSENPVISFQYVKNLSGNPGEFILILKSDRNLMAEIVPGDWLVVYLSQGGLKLSNKKSSMSSVTPGVPQQYVIASSSNSIDEIAVPGPGKERTYYWTPEQYVKFREETDAISWSGNIVDLADQFDNRVKNGQIDTTGVTINQNENSEYTDGWSMRCMGNVNRITKSETLDNYGKKSITYTVTGFDFGKVFTNTTSFYNTFWGEQGDVYNDLDRAMAANKAEDNRLSVDYSINSVEGWIRGWIRLLLGPRVSDSRMTEQWHLPDGMAQYLYGSYSNDSINSNKNLFYDILDTYFSPDTGGLKLTRQLPVSLSLWQLLTNYAHTNINEIFYELDDSKSQENCVPKLYVRMMPYAFKTYKDTDGGLNNNDILRFLDIPEVNIGHDQVINLSVGLSDHARSNMFFTYNVADSSNQSESTAIFLDPEVLTLNNPIKRYGLSVNGGSDEFGLLTTGVPDTKLMNSINSLIKHWMKNNQCILNGSALINGNPNVRIGKRLVIHPEESDHKYQQHYYISQYSDSWSFPGLWTQSLILDRGVYTKDGEEVYAHQVEDRTFKTAGTSVIKGIVR